MLIDWFTVGAQALNFIILVWLLKRYLYKPILNAVDVREKRIAAELGDADAEKAEAQKEREEFQHKNEEFDQQRAALSSKATDEAKAEREQLLDDARKAADALNAKRQEALRSDANNLKQAIRRRTQQEVFAIARKALSDLATTSLEERTSEVFTQRLRSMDGKAKEGLAEALRTTSPSPRSCAAHSTCQRRNAEQSKRRSTRTSRLTFTSGSRPRRTWSAGSNSPPKKGQKIAWSIADYLASLEKAVGELLKEKEKPEAKAAPKPEPKIAPKIDAKAPSKPEEPKPGTPPQ